MYACKWPGADHPLSRRDAGAGPPVSAPSIYPQRRRARRSREPRGIPAPNRLKRLISARYPAGVNGLSTA